jgi:hypothetical protein
MTTQTQERGDGAGDDAAPGRATFGGVHGRHRRAVLPTGRVAVAALLGASRAGRRVGRRERWRSARSALSVGSPAGP